MFPSSEVELTLANSLQGFGGSEEYPNEVFKFSGPDPGGTPKTPL